MKRLMCWGGLFVGVAAIIFLGGLDLIFNFIITGHLPLLNISLSPLYMLLLWMLIVPVLVVSQKAIVNVSWNIIEIVGRFDQRKINQRARLRSSSYGSEPLVVSTLLIIASELTPTTEHSEELSPQHLLAPTV